MIEFQIIGAENIDPSILRSCGACFCTYWHVWVINADDKEQAMDRLNSVGVYCEVRNIG
jgi:hypothetical protein